jgi:hypothetical protein
MFRKVTLLGGSRRDDVQFYARFRGGVQAGPRFLSRRAGTVFSGELDFPLPKLLNRRGFEYNRRR